MTKRGLGAAWMGCLLVLAGSAASAAETPRTVTIRVEGQRLEAELASTPHARRRGLMGRQRLERDRGMLFLWPEAEQRAFWMKDTPLPLSVAFLDRRGRILNIETMVPLREDVHYRSRRPARFALEANRGWFRENGIRPGDRCRFRVPAEALPWREEALVVGGP